MNNYKISSCGNCKHAVLDNGVQAACSLNKINTLVESGFAKMDSISGYYDLFKICLFRNKDIDEVTTPIGYVFILKDASQLEQLKINIDLIINKNPLWIGIVHDLVDSTKDIINQFGYMPFPTNIICNHSPTIDIVALDMFMKNYRNGWTIVNVIGEEFNLNLSNSLDKYLNSGKSPVALIKPDNDSINGTCFYNFIYKYLKGSTVEINPTTEEIINKTYEEKIKDSSPNMIKTWKEINEINNSFTDK